MTTVDKLIFCKEHGISISYIANLLELSPATLTKWMRGEKGITKRNERAIELTLQKLAHDIWVNVGEEYEQSGNQWNLSN